MQRYSSEPCEAVEEGQTEEEIDRNTNLTHSDSASCRVVVNIGGISSSHRRIRIRVSDHLLPEIFLPRQTSGGVFVLGRADNSNDRDDDGYFLTMMVSRNTPKKKAESECMNKRCPAKCT
jgi:hypothetical protein